jgi:hypothetical protein
MLKSTSQLGSEARAFTADTIRMDTLIRTAIPTTGRIGIMAIIGLTTGTAGIVITATSVIRIVRTVIIGNEMT